MPALSKAAQLAIIRQADRPQPAPVRYYPYPLDLPACFICGSIGGVCVHREPELVAWYTEIQRARVYFAVEAKRADPS